ncbi:uncharacterized protein LOC126975928 [Leptidea sinapis]|uniref:uncharacterized protein LOC126975928 n=1 Tax=Leptidea sinapis TaxID=189913 RepID=UPI0021C40712|nr:uncharacterized protein LOC126975928 [Leptidea sinapis]
MIPLNYFLKIFSLNLWGPVQLSKISQFIFILPAIMLGCLVVTALYLKITYFYHGQLVSIKYTDAVEMFFDFFLYCVDLISVHKYRLNTKQYLYNYQKIDEILGMKCCLLVKNRLVRLIVVFFLVWAISSVCDYAGWTLAAGWLSATVFSLSYVFFLIKILTSLDLTSQIMQIEYRLSTIADIVSVSFTSQNSLANIESKVKCFVKCYLMLLDQTSFVNQVYGKRVRFF